MPSITLREMHSDDWDRVQEIYQLGIDTNLATFETKCPTWGKWDIAHTKECRIVAELQSEVVGWAALSAVSSRCVYSGVAEVSVYVDADSRGSGVGAALLNELCTLSEKYGYWTLQSGIIEDNKASIKLHEKAGFRLVGYREKIGKDRNGIWRKTVLMERRSSFE